MSLQLPTPFPDLRLPDHTGRDRSLSELARAQPLVLCFVRGWWCPKEQVRVRMLVDMQEEIQREYGKLCAVTVDEPYVNGAFRAGIGAQFPFLSDEHRRIGEELGLLELTDEKHRPFLPLTFVLDSLRRVQRAWCGFWYWGNPTPDELRVALREITRSEQPSFDPFAAWSGRREAGIEGETIWIREDSEGREIQRGVHDGPVPDAGEVVSKSAVDGRPWLVHEAERDGDRTFLHLRKGGKPDESRLVRHSMVAPR